jgi:hypothetical protein
VALGEAVRSLDGAKLHLSAGGNGAFISITDHSQAAHLDQHLRGLGLSGVVLRGDIPLWLGRRTQPAIAQAVKQALDPLNRFPSLDD